MLLKYYSVNIKIGVRIVRLPT